MESKQSEKDLKTSQPAVEDSEEEENDILEESPCGRWLKRREEVEQNNIPGIDATYLAMDTEEGVEVVWNEVRFSERKYFKAKEEIISEVFDRLIQLEHPNIVKLHKYWIHKDADIPKVVFITEYMSSGSLKQYFKKTKRHDIKISLQVWRRWCTQTLSALCYLHSSQPSIVHGNINCDTIFISYNGLIKIGAIAPDAIHRHVKTVRADAKSNLHFIAPELGNDQDPLVLSSAVDIYSFGMCALEMAALEISTDEESLHHITEEIINKTIDSLENPLQKDFIQKCLRNDPNQRPSARDLLFHPIIFEVPSLRLFCAHSILNNPSLQPEQLTEDAISRFLCLQNQSDRIIAELKRSQQPSIIFKLSDFPNRELEKFLDEVKNGACPLTAIITTTRPPLVSRQRTISPEVIDDAHKLINTPDNPYDEETRRIVYINCCIQPLSTDLLSFDVKIVIKLDDKINRQLTCEILKEQFIPASIAQELVYFGFINKDDTNNVADILNETLNEILLHSNNPACFEKSLQIQKPCNTTNIPQVPIQTAPQQSQINNVTPKDANQNQISNCASIMINEGSSQVNTSPQDSSSRPLIVMEEESQVKSLITFDSNEPCVGQVPSHLLGNTAGTTTPITNNNSQCQYPSNVIVQFPMNQTQHSQLVQQPGQSLPSGFQVQHYPQPATNPNVQNEHLSLIDHTFSEASYNACETPSNPVSQPSMYQQSSQEPNL